MRADQKEALAALLRDVHIQRLELDKTLAELEQQTKTLSALEARLLVTSTNLRLLRLEERLWSLSHPRGWSLSSALPDRFRSGRTRDRLRYLNMRVRALSRPRIGVLRHYLPRPLEVPSSYLRDLPPDPAPTISIVTPCFEHGVFLERTLRSVLDQGYPALEYFVQDGGSTDETLEILRRYDERLDGWVSEQDTGQADALNRAFARTSGEIMAWLNSDDLLLPGSLAYVSRYFATHPEVDVVYGNRIMIDRDDGEIGAWILPAHDDLALTLADYVPQETLFWRRRIWDAAGGGMDLSFSYALDWDLLLRFRAAGATMVRLPRFIGAFRIHDEQKTSASQEVGLAEMGRLRERVHGRSLSAVEIRDQLRPYLRRHVILHTRHRMIDRLARFRRTVGVLAPAVETKLGEPAKLPPPLTAGKAKTAPGPQSGH